MFRKQPRELSVNKKQLLNQILSSSKIKDSHHAQEKRKEIDPVIENTSVPVAEKVRNAFKIFTNVRLATSLSSLLLSYFKRDQRSLLPKKFGFLGLSYILEFGFYLGEIFYFTFRKPVTEETKNLPYGKRILTQFKTILQKDGLISDMANAGAWGAINLATIIMTAGLLPSIISLGNVTLNLLTAIVVGGMTFDLLHIAAVSIFNIDANKKLKRHYERELEDVYNKLDENINQLDNKLELYNTILNVLNDLQQNAASNEDVRTRIIHLKNDMSELEQDIGALNQEITDLENIKSEIENTVKSSKKSALYYVSMSTIALGGMVLSVACPPAAPVGALMMWFGGCVMTGLGEKLFNNIYHHFKDKHAAHQNAPATLNDATEIEPNLEAITPYKGCKLLLQPNPSQNTTVLEKPLDIEMVTCPKAKNKTIEHATNLFRNFFFHKGQASLPKNDEHLAAERKIICRHNCN